MVINHVSESWYDPPSSASQRPKLAKVKFAGALLFGHLCLHAEMNFCAKREFCWDFFCSANDGREDFGF